MNAVDQTPDKNPELKNRPETASEQETLVMKLEQDFQEEPPASPAGEKLVFTGDTKKIPSKEDVLLEELYGLLGDEDQDGEKPLGKTQEAGSPALSGEEETEAPEFRPAEPETLTAPEAALEDAAESSGEAPMPRNPGREPLAAMTYTSVAEAMETAKAEPSESGTRSPVDDETLLAELYALIGDGQTEARQTVPEAKAPSKPVQPAPAKITADALKDVSEELDEGLEEDTLGVPGWVKGVFLVLVSLLLSGMTLYAVATDLLGKIF